MNSHIIQYKGYNIYYYEPLYKVAENWYTTFSQAKEYIDELTKDDDSNYQIVTNPKNKNK